MAARAPLHLVEPADDVVPVPAGLLSAAIDNAIDIADDLEAGIEAVTQRLFAGNRAAAFNELGRLAVRIDSFRDDFAALSPDDSNPPPRPHRVA